MMYGEISTPRQGLTVLAQAMAKEPPFTMGKEQPIIRAAQHSAEVRFSLSINPHSLADFGALADSLNKALSVVSGPYGGVHPSHEDIGNVFLSVKFFDGAESRLNGEDCRAQQMTLSFRLDETGWTVPMYEIELLDLYHVTYAQARNAPANIQKRLTNWNLFRDVNGQAEMRTEMVHKITVETVRLIVDSYKSMLEEVMVSGNPTYPNLKHPNQPRP